MNNGWNNCGCGTTYLDAYGQTINRAPVRQSNACSPDWGLLAVVGVAAIAGAMLAGKK